MIHTNKIFEDKQVGIINITVTKESIPAFQELVHRATNLWPDAPPEIKEFADVITNGHILQDYYGQDTSPTKK